MRSLYLFLILLPVVSFADPVWTRLQVLDYVNNSPKYVDIHDKKSWVGLFADDAFIQDPVGGLTFRKDVFSDRFQQNRIEMFWDAFIAKNNIHFEIKNEIVSDLSVIRDAVVQAYLPKSNATVNTPAHLRYNLKVVDGQLRVKSLQAYWNFAAVAAETLGRGKLGLSIMKEQLANMNQGLGLKLELGHFLKGYIVGIHKIGPRRVRNMVTALNSGKSKKFASYFHRGALVKFNSTHTTMKPADFIQAGYKIENVSKVISSGYSVAFNCTLKNPDGKSMIALGIAHFKPLRLESLELFTDSR